MNRNPAQDKPVSGEAGVKGSSLFKRSVSGFVRLQLMKLLATFWSFAHLETLWLTPSDTHFTLQIEWMRTQDLGMQLVSGPCKPAED